MIRNKKQEITLLTVIVLLNRKLIPSHLYLFRVALIKHVSSLKNKIFIIGINREQLGECNSERVAYLFLVTKIYV